jgi:WD40 repeat protein
VITWSEDGTRIALSGNDADVTIIDAETGEIDLVLSGHDASIYATAWHPSGEKLASIAFDNEDTRIWDVTPDGPESRGFIAVRGAGALGGPDGMGRLLYIASGIGADLIDPESGIAASFDLAAGVPDLALVSEDGNFVTGLDRSGAGVILHVESGGTTTLHECALPGGISWDGTYLAVDSGCDHEEFSAGVIDVATGEHVINLRDQSLGLADFTRRVGPGNQEYVAFVVPRSDFIGGQEPDELQVWGMDPLEQVFSIEHTQIGNLFLFPRFSHDGRYLGVGTNGGRSAVIDVEAALSGAPADDYLVFNREGHSGNAPMAVPTDSGLVATGGHDGFFRIWDIETGELVMDIDVRGEENPRPSLGWSPDGSTLYYMHDPLVIGRLPIDPAEMIELATSVLTRSLTDDECRQYLHTDGCR